MDNPKQVANSCYQSKHTKHPLKEVFKNSKFECECCKIEGQGMRYRCHECNVDIHLSCETCPSSLPSFTHPNHTLQFMDKPKLPIHKCNLCLQRIKGKVYRCKECRFFVHPMCSQFPEYLVEHDIHPPHTLKLQLMASSKCDVCDKSCKHWRYFCEICDVHIHVGCLPGKGTSDDDDDDEGGFGGIIFDILSTLIINAPSG
ncbi:diacylglycerol kinase theta-like [Chenopodium quinoa]|uniref:diacylglycerol kinase theta-like n=1 Tax=Chenopodium quinoa TaxID=63459 RepID=UPI000B79748A|nr:diacylglycerol kinase theta-like [Chenopodium quinoa]XP_021756871.1 diacylglycerol kinase theta-like [Chenopodium quinoa]